MKKKIIPLAAIAIVAVAAAVGVSKNANEVELSDLALTNVEALAECEKLLGTCWISFYDYNCCDAGDQGCAPCGQW